MWSWMKSVVMILNKQHCLLLLRYVMSKPVSMPFVGHWGLPILFLSSSGNQFQNLAIIDILKKWGSDCMSMVSGIFSHKLFSYEMCVSACSLQNNECHTWKFGLRICLMMHISMYYLYTSSPASRQKLLVYHGNKKLCSSSCIFPVRKWEKFWSFFFVMKQPLSVLNPWLPSLTRNTNRADNNIHTFPKVPVEAASGIQHRHIGRWKHTSPWSKSQRDEAGDMRDPWRSDLIFRDNKTYSGANFQNAEEEYKIHWASQLEGLPNLLVGWGFFFFF